MFKFKNFTSKFWVLDSDFWILYKFPIFSILTWIYSKLIDFNAFLSIFIRFYRVL